MDNPIILLSTQYGWKVAPGQGFLATFYRRDGWTLSKVQRWIKRHYAAR